MKKSVTSKGWRSGWPKSSVYQSNSLKNSNKQSISAEFISFSKQLFDNYINCGRGIGL